MQPTQKRSQIPYAKEVMALAIARDSVAWTLWMPKNLQAVGGWLGLDLGMVLRNTDPTCRWNTTAHSRPHTNGEEQDQQEVEELPGHRIKAHQPAAGPRGR
jgi:hypothetical protein